MSNPRQIEIIADPRPDLTEDSEIWSRVLTLTHWYTQDLAALLHALRVSGLRLVGGCKFLPGEMSKSEWQTQRPQLAARGKEVARILRWARWGGVPIESAVLGGELVWLTPEPRWLQSGLPGTAYTPAEVRALSGRGPDAVRAFHRTKREQVPSTTSKGR